MPIERSRLVSIILLVACSSALIAASSNLQTDSHQMRQTPSLPPDKATYLKLAGETETMLRQDVLDVWFPRSVDDKNGGFYSGFTRDWKPAPSEGKFSVFQGRMTWISARLCCVGLN